MEYVTGLSDRLRAVGLRSEVNDKPGERMQAKVRAAELRKSPYVVVVGKRDVERGDDAVTVRDTRRGEQQTVPAADLISRLLEEVAARRPQ
jgi:threonyl-tRNA synthetase